MDFLYLYIQNRTMIPLQFFMWGRRGLRKEVVGVI
jgi:hypothetical protein